MGGMTLVEVLVALAIVSLVFTALVQMTFDALKRAKTLELQDKMRNYATEAIQTVYSAKDTDWEKVFGQSGVLPPDVVNPQAYIVYPDTSSTSELKPPELAALATNQQCSFNESKNVFSASCTFTSGNELVTRSSNKKIFGRIIRRTDYSLVNFDTTNHAKLEVIVACIDMLCDPATFRPFKLTFDVYRTSAPR